MAVILAMISWIWHPNHRQQKLIKTNRAVKHKLCTSKETINRMKNNLQNKRFTNYIWERVNIQNILKTPIIQQKNKTKQIAWWKWAKIWIDISQKKIQIQMTNKHIKRYLKSLIIREMKTTTRYKSPKVGLLLSKTKQSNNNNNNKTQKAVNKDVENWNPLAVFVGLQNSTVTMKNNMKFP